MNMKFTSIILGGAALALSTSLWANTNTNLSTTQLQNKQAKSFMQNSFAGTRPTLRKVTKQKKGDTSHVKTPVTTGARIYNTKEYRN